MAIIRPFKAYRPIGELVQKIAALPYDVMDSKEARNMVINNPYSFLYIDKPEINFPENMEPDDEKLYKKAKENLDNMITNGYYVEECKPCLYIYKKTANNRSQIGIVGCASIDEYSNNIIKKHEFTREDKEVDRINHVYTCEAHTGPIFLTYRHNNDISEIITKWTVKTPIYEFVSEDGINHTIWRVDSDETIGKITQLFREVDYLYIADGHHRAASAVKVGQRKRAEVDNYTGEEEFNYFLSIAYADDELQVMDYNRAVKDLNGLSLGEFLQKVKEKFSVTEMNGPIRPMEKHAFGMYIENKWYLLKALTGTFNNGNPKDQLDVSILQNNILKSILGIDDPRKSKKIEFIGGVRGLYELERRVNTDMKVAFSMFPPTIEDIMTIADKGEVMPPKSTWFEPKPRSGIFLHKF